MLEAELGKLVTGMADFYLDLKLNHFVILVDRNNPELRRIQVFSDDREAKTIRWDDFEYSCNYAGVDPKPFKRHFS